MGVGASGDPAERLRQNTNRDTESGCWLWLGAPGNTGYGRLSLNDKLMQAHNVAWVVASGAPIPPGKIVGHTCDVRLCVRNDDHGTYIVDGIEYERYGHLFLTTYLGNMRDMIQKGRERHDGVQGEKHWGAKLTENDVRAIRSRYAAGGIGTQALAQDFGVTKSQAKRIVRGESWRHVQ